jgi:hypothetical protein
VAFSNGQNVQAADLNNLSITTLTTTGDITCGDDMAVAGDLVVTGTITQGGSGSATPLAPGRLTLTTAVPVTTSDVTAATTLYYALYSGNVVTLYSGSAWVESVIGELSIAVPATTNQMYDVFIDYNGGAPALSLTAWSNDTTRATALAYQNGRLVLNGTATKLYVGSFRTTGVSGQTEDSFAKRYVWNYYNRVVRPMRVLEATNTWTYTTASYQQANANAANQLDFVVGVAEDGIEATVQGIVSNDNQNVFAQVSIGLDSATVPATGVLMDRSRTTGAGTAMYPKASLRTIPAVGRHYLAWLEYSDAGVGTTTWYGDNNTPTLLQSGIHGLWRA